jgi:hypothetical protein
MIRPVRRHLGGGERIGLPVAGGFPEYGIALRDVPGGAATDDRDPFTGHREPVARCSGRTPPAIGLAGDLGCRVRHAVTPCVDAHL